MEPPVIGATRGEVDVAASKQRLQWGALPLSIRTVIEGRLGGRVIAAGSCSGGFSPGMASRLTLDDGRRVFVKAMDGRAWPDQIDPYRAEAQVAASLPATVPAPRLLWSLEDDRWIVLAFDNIDGREPTQPWTRTELDRVLATVGQLSQPVTPSPIALSRAHPRLGGWAELAGDRHRLTRLTAYSAWVADQLPHLEALEQEGLSTAQGDTLVHFDLYPHNILLTADRVLFVDWPHARLGAPFLDLVMLLSSASADGIDPDPILHHHPLTARVDPPVIDAVLAAHAGFLLATGLDPHPPGLQPIAEAKIRLGRATLRWLRQRLGVQ